METKRSAYRLNTSALDRALSILDKVEQDYRLTPAQRFAFTLLNIAVYAVGITLFIILISWLFKFFKFDLGFLESVADYLLLSLYSAGTAIILIIAVLIVLNFGLLAQFVRLNKLMRTVGISYVFDAPWRAERKRKKLLNFLTLCLGPFVIVGSISFYLANLLVDGFLSIGLSTGVAFITMHLLRRNKERVDVIERLQTSFSRYRETAGQEETKQAYIPQAEYDMFAKIERAQIVQERAKSILASQMESTDDTYLVQKSHAFREARASLNASEKRRIQSQIDAITVEPRPKSVSKDPDSGVLRLRVPDTSTHIHYKVNEDLHRIKILSLEVDDDASTESEPKG